MMGPNYHVTVGGRINDAPICSTSQVLQADDLRNVSVGARRWWLRAKKRSDLGKVLDAAEKH